MIKSFRTTFRLVTAYKVRLIVSQVALAISAPASIGFATLVAPMVNNGMVAGNADDALSIGFWMLILGPGGRGDVSDSDCRGACRV
jgi:hypothetical protein